MAPTRDQGLAALQRGDYDAAISYLEQIQAMAPADCHALLCLAGAYHQTKRDDDAVRVLLQVALLQPDNARAYYNLGVSLERLHRYDEARDALRRALTLKPDYTLAAAVLAKWEQTDTGFQECSVVTSRNVGAEPTPIPAAPASSETKDSEPAVLEPSTPEPPASELSVLEPSVSESTITETSTPEPSVPEPTLPDSSVSEPSAPGPSVASYGIGEPATGASSLAANTTLPDSASDGTVPAPPKKRTRRTSKTRRVEGLEGEEAVATGSMPPLSEIPAAPLEADPSVERAAPLASGTAAARDNTATTGEDVTTVRDDAPIVEEDATTVRDDALIVEEAVPAARDDTAPAEGQVETARDDGETVEDDATPVEEDTATLKGDATSFASPSRDLAPLPDAPLPDESDSCLGLELPADSRTPDDLAPMAAESAGGEAVAAPASSEAAQSTTGPTRLWKLFRRRPQPTDLEEHGDSAPQQAPEDATRHDEPRASAPQEEPRDLEPYAYDFWRILCPEARQALWLAAGSLFIVGFGLFFGPMAISRAITAKSRIAGSSDANGNGAANAAIAIAAVGIMLSVIEWSYLFIWVLRH